MWSSRLTELLRPLLATSPQLRDKNGQRVRVHRAFIVLIADISPHEIHAAAVASSTSAADRVSEVDAALQADAAFNPLWRSFESSLAVRFSRQYQELKLHNRLARFIALQPLRHQQVPAFVENVLQHRLYSAPDQLHGTTSNDRKSAEEFTRVAHELQLSSAVRAQMAAGVEYETTTLTVAPNAGTGSTTDSHSLTFAARGLREMLLGADSPVERVLRSLLDSQVAASQQGHGGNSLSKETWLAELGAKFNIDLKDHDEAVGSLEGRDCGRARTEISRAVLTIEVQTDAHQSVEVTGQGDIHVRSSGKLAGRAASPAASDEWVGTRCAQDYECAGARGGTWQRVGGLYGCELFMHVM